jgi:probable rRNA maturation factor
MIVTVELNNKTKFKVPKKLIRNIFEKTFERLDLSGNLAKKEFEISVAFLENEEIKKINLACRKKNSPTDVLSFSEYESIEDLLNEKKQQIFLGELLVSMEFVKLSAMENGVTFQYEIPYILSHGLLHLIGMSHGEKMFSIQDEVALEFQKEF